MPLYNCRSHQPNEWAITKLTDDLDPENTYVLRPDPDSGEITCECPAGIRPTCRHRQMLPHFTAANRVNTGWVLDWDNGAQWRQYVGPLGVREDEFGISVSKLAEDIAHSAANELAFEPEATEPYQPFASDTDSQSPSMRRRGF